MTADARIEPLPTSSPPLTGLMGTRRYLAIGAVSLGTILTTVSGGIVNVALPTMSRELHIAPSAAVLVVTIYQLVLMMTLLPMSALGHRIGHRALYQQGQLVFVVATLLSFFAHSLPFLLIVRAFQALGAAAAMSVSAALIRAIYPASRLGRGLAFNTVIAAGFATLAPSVGGAILAVARWPWLFAALVPFGVLSLIMGQKSLPETAPRDDPFDWLGAIMCAATFGLAITGLETGLHGDSPVISAALAVIGVALGVVFVRRELRQPWPMLPVDLMRRPDIAFTSAGMLAGYLSSAIVLLSLAFRLQQHFHYAPAEVGAVLAVWPFVILFVGPISGTLSDRLPAGLLGGIGMAIATVGLVSLSFLPATPDHFAVIWRMAVSGLGFGMFYSPNARLMIASAPVERSASAGALTTTIRGAGQTVGATAVAALLACGLGTGSAPTLLAAGLTAVAGLCCLAVLRQPVLPAVYVDLPGP